MKILVTGGNGFIGSNLCSLLVANGHEVTAMVLKGTSTTNLDGINCSIVNADITRPETLKGILSGIDLVYHLAALPSSGWSDRIFEVNYQGTKNMLEASVNAGVKRFVLMSSLVVHGFKNFDGADEQTPVLKPGLFTRPYTASKIKCEELIAAYKNKIETVVIRPGFQIYGPKDRLASYEMMERLTKGKFIAYLDGGNNHMGYVYVENLVYGLLCAGTHSAAPGNTYILCDYQPPYTTLKSFFAELGKALNAETKISSYPSGLVKLPAFLVDALYFTLLRNKMPLFSIYTVNAATHNLHFNPAKAIREIGFKQQVSFEEGIRRTAQWYRNVNSNQGL